MMLSNYETARARYKRDRKLGIDPPSDDPSWHLHVLRKTDRFLALGFSLGFVTGISFAIASWWQLR